MCPTCWLHPRKAATKEDLDRIDKKQSEQMDNTEEQLLRRLDNLTEKVTSCMGGVQCCSTVCASCQLNVMLAASVEDVW